MKGFLKKYSFSLLAISIIILYFFTRFYNILSLPIFTDEAIYVRWAQIAGNDASWRLISLTDGKQPMFVWIAMILMKVINDPLLAGRTVSVLAGFGSVIGIFFLTNELFKNKKLGFLASFIYVLYPFAIPNETSDNRINFPNFLFHCLSLKLKSSNKKGKRINAKLAFVLVSIPPPIIMPRINAISSLKCRISKCK